MQDLSSSDRTDGLQTRRLTVAQAAEYLNKRPPTLNRWRWLRTGPRYVKVGNRVLYNVADLESWIESNAVEPVAGDVR